MSDKRENPRGNGKEVKDYGYGEVTETNMITGQAKTRIFTGPMDANGNSPYFDVKGRGAQG